MKKIRIDNNTSKLIIYCEQSVRYVKMKFSMNKAKNTQFSLFIIIEYAAVQLQLQSQLSEDKI